MACETEDTNQTDVDGALCSFLSAQDRRQRSSSEIVYVFNTSALPPLTDVLHIASHATGTFREHSSILFFFQSSLRRDLVHSRLLTPYRHTCICTPVRIPRSRRHSSNTRYSNVPPPLIQYQQPHQQRPASVPSALVRPVRPARLAPIHSNVFNSCM